MFELHCVPRHFDITYRYVTMDEPTPAADAPSTTATIPNESSGQTPNKTKRKRKIRHTKPHIHTQLSLRKPLYSYIHLRHTNSTTVLTTTSPAPALDALTAYLHLTSALTQFLGLHGAAINFDILNLSDQDVWIRVAAEDRSAVVAAVGGWMNGKGEGWRVMGWSAWDVSVSGGARGGEDLFTD